MISENFDGEWIARIIEQFGFRTSRGSSSRGGQRSASPVEARNGAGDARRDLLSMARAAR